MGPSGQKYGKSYPKASQIPHSERGRLGVDERLKKAILLQEKYIRLTASSFQRVVVGTVSELALNAMASSAVSAVVDREMVDAIERLARFFKSPDLAKLVESAQKAKAAAVFSSLASTFSLRSHGRLAASDLQGVNRVYKEYEPTLIKQYCREAELKVIGCIHPALEQITSEHDVREQDILKLLARSSTVPPESREIEAKGILAGFRSDFTVALHLLAPRMEDLVRYHLKNSNSVTRSVLKNGATTENGLTNMMELPETIEIFGEDLAFEIRAVFCDSLGPNYRNDVAHGLVSYESCESPMSVYAWWLYLKVACLDFSNPIQAMPV